MTKITKTKPIRRSRASPKTQGRLPRGLTERIVWHSVDDLKPFPGNPRQHPESQIAGLMKSIRKVWTIVASENLIQLTPANHNIIAK